MSGRLLFEAKKAFDILQYNETLLTKPSPAPIEILIQTTEPLTFLTISDDSDYESYFLDLHLINRESLVLIEGVVTIANGTSDSGVAHTFYVNIKDDTDTVVSSSKLRWFPDTDDWQINIPILFYDNPMTRLPMCKDTIKYYIEVAALSEESGNCYITQFSLNGTEFGL